MRFFYLILSVLLLVACVRSNERSFKGDLIKSQSTNKYAQLFSLSDSGSYFRLDIGSPWQGGEEIIYTYYLLKESGYVHSRMNELNAVEIPIRTSVCMSTTHIAMISALGFASQIRGVSGLDYVSDSTLREKIAEGKVKDIGYDSNLNNELIASLDPDVVFVYGVGAESAGYISKLKEAGITTIYISDYLEVHPLAKAEWVKLFGVLYGKYNYAVSLFDTIEADYNRTKSLIANNKNIEKPKVMLGLPYKDKWFISPGNSYINTLIEDAGGDYLWSRYTSKESMPMGLESVYVEALDSDYWLNIGTADSRDDILSVDARFKELPPVIYQRLFNNTLRLNESGGNDYWESGALFPNIILKDIACILHPELMGDHELYYYKQIK